jgi:hypothetical protein
VATGARPARPISATKIRDIATTAAKNTNHLKQEEQRRHPHRSQQRSAPKKVLGKVRGGEDVRRRACMAVWGAK